MIILKFLVFFIFVFSNVRARCITSNEKNVKLIERRIARDVVRQISAKGVNVWIVLVKSQEIEGFISSFMKTIPMCYVDLCIKFNPTKFMKKSYNYKVASGKTKINDYGTPLITLATRSTPFILVTRLLNMERTINMFESFVWPCFARTSSSKSVPNVIIVLITHKNWRNFHKLYRYLTEARVINVDILEIKMSKVKKNLKNNKMVVNHTIHQYNPFSKKYQKQCYNKFQSNGNVKWLRQELNDFMGFKLNTTKEQNTRVKKNSTLYGDGPHSDLFRSFKREFNYTMNQVPKSLAKKLGANREKSIIDISCSERRYNYPVSSATEMKPLYLETAYMYTPVIRTRVIEFHFFTILCHVAVFILVVIIFQKFSSYFILDIILWNHFSIMGLILGIGTARKLVKLAEQFLLVNVIVVGIFFANDIIFGAMNYAVSVIEEKWFNTFSDLKESGITAFVLYDPNINRRVGVFQPNIALLASNVSYVIFKGVGQKFVDELEGAILNMMYYKNTSVSSMRSKSLDVLLDDSIYVGNECKARKSHIAEVTFLRTYYLMNYSPFLECFSDYYWRFKEAGFVDFQEVQEHKLNFYGKNVYSSEETADDNQDTKVLILILIVGFGAAIVVLICERNIYLNKVE